MASRPGPKDPLYIAEIDEQQRSPLVVGRELTVQVRVPTKMICTLSLLKNANNEQSVIVAWVTGGKNEVVRLSLPNAPAHLVSGIRDRLKGDPKEINFQSPERRVLGIIAATQANDPRSWAWWTKKDGVRLPGKTDVSLETAVKQALDNIILLYQSELIRAAKLAYFSG